MQRLRLLSIPELVQLKTQNTFEFGPARFQEKSMENIQGRAIGLLVAFATVLTLMAVWSLPETVAQREQSSPKLKTR
jgi:hypothetical protein